MTEFQKYILSKIKPLIYPLWYKEIRRCVIKSNKYDLLKKEKRIKNRKSDIK